MGCHISWYLALLPGLELTRTKGPLLQGSIRSRLKFRIALPDHSLIQYKIICVLGVWELRVKGWEFQNVFLLLKIFAFNSLKLPGFNRPDSPSTPARPTEIDAPDLHQRRETQLGMLVLIYKEFAPVWRYTELCSKYKLLLSGQHALTVHNWKSGYCLHV